MTIPKDVFNEHIETIEKNIEELRQKTLFFQENDPVVIADLVNKIINRWSYFGLSITDKPVLYYPLRILKPEIISEDPYQEEYVYPIHDTGCNLITSKGEELFTSGMSMCKFYYTIEKIIYLLVERIKEANIGKEEEVSVFLFGSDLAKRKAFESIINLEYNVVVANFEPGLWGDFYLDAIKKIAKKYGYPANAPRQPYREHLVTPAPKIR